MKRQQLSKKEISKLNELLQGKYEIPKKANVSLIDDNHISINGNVLFFYHENKLVPSLKLLQENNFLKKITVDMGA